MRLYQPTPRVEFSTADFKELAKELKDLGFGWQQRNPEHAGKYPLLDELTYLVQTELGDIPAPMIAISVCFRGFMLNESDSDPTKMIRMPISCDELSACCI